MFALDVYDAEIQVFLRNLPEDTKEAIRGAVHESATMLYVKVIENLSGKILESKSGFLKGSIEVDIDTSGNPMVAFVGPKPASPKAWALEYGGKSSYEILPTKASVLHFFKESGEEVFTRYVEHPPSKEFAYLRSALREMEPAIYNRFVQAIYGAPVSVLGRGFR